MLLLYCFHDKLLTLYFHLEMRWLGLLGPSSMHLRLIETHLDSLRLRRVTVVVPRLVASCGMSPSPPKRSHGPKKVARSWSQPWKRFASRSERIAISGEYVGNLVKPRQPWSWQFPCEIISRKVWECARKAKTCKDILSAYNLDHLAHNARVCNFLENTFWVLSHAVCVLRLEQIPLYRASQFHRNHLWPSMITIDES